MNVKKRIFSFLFCILFISSLFSQQKSVLFLGNSYTAVNNLPQMFYDLALSGGDTVIFDSNSPGGYTFQLHSTNATSLAKINAKPWDYVVLQEQSQIPAFPPSQVATDCLPYAHLLDSLIHVNYKCSQTVFYMTWGRKYGDASNCANYPPICSFSGMTASLRQSYVQMADDNAAITAPAGMAWKASRAADSTINLWSGDNSHPSVAGSYLTACVFYATIYEKTPIGLHFYSSLSPAQATFLQNIAHHTVFDSLSVWNIGEFKPDANFVISDANGYNRGFSNLSANSNIYLWDFGDGTQSTLSSPQHTYSHPGNYPVTLIASNGCISDTLLDTITIVKPVLAWQQANKMGKGMNLSYLENYWAGNQAIGYMDYLHHLPNVSTYKDDIALMKQMGFNTLRLPVCFDKWEDGVAPYNIDSVSYFAAVDSFVKWTGEQGLNLSIDFHHGRLDSANFATELPRLSALWTQIATHFANAPHESVFFEVYNEPFNISTEKWKEAALALISGIRAVDYDRTLIIGGQNWNGISGLQEMGALPDSNIIYTYHYYEPFIFTHQGASWVGNVVATTGIPFPYNAATMPTINPLAVGTWGEGAFNYYNVGGTAATILSWMSPVKKWSDSTELPIFCGEWGSFKQFAPQDGSRCRYTEAIKNGLDSMQIPNTYWEWDAGFSIFDGVPSLTNLPTCMADVWNISIISISPAIQNTVKVFPNPAQNQLFIETKEPFSEMIVTDMTGKVVFQSSFQKEFSVENLANGVYILTLKGDKGDFVAKCVKMK